MEHQVNRPTLPPLASGQYDCSPPDIMAGDPLQYEDIAAASTQLQYRQVLAMTDPPLVTTDELVAAREHPHRIEQVHFDIVGPDGNPAPAWVQLLLDRMDENEMRQQHRYEQREQRLFQRLDELERRLLQAIRTTTGRDELTPVVRIHDGQEPADFPTTLQDLMSAEDPRITELLQFYSLPNNGTLAEKKEILLQHLGCTL